MSKTISYDTTVDINIDIDELLEEADDCDLIAELKSRGYCVAGDDQAHSRPSELNYFLPKSFNKTQLRDVLTDITGLGTHASDDEILNQLKFLINF